MKSIDRAETIAIALVWTGGLVLFAWSWQASGSFLAGLFAAAIGGFFLLLAIGPLIALAALIIAAASRLILPPRP